MYLDFGAAGPVGALDVPLTEGAFRRGDRVGADLRPAAGHRSSLAAGRGRGATADITLIVPGGASRDPDEPIRHKVLDAWGDLARLGPALVETHVDRGTHLSHLALWRASRLPDDDLGPP